MKRIGISSRQTVHLRSLPGCIESGGVWSVAFFVDSDTVVYSRAIYEPCEDLEELDHFANHGVVVVDE
jgi:hypothetical protein